jgi:hypothetical protein
MRTCIHLAPHAKTRERFHADLCRLCIFSQFVPEISYNIVRDAYDEALNTCMGGLVNSVMLKLDAALVPLSRTRWADLESVGDQSAYVDGIKTALIDTVPQ